ncbi:hypothetical protein POJ06DRAFT_131157 [Lipomyces tetrasporus]|uniref:Uncharacterized protein n=1 Tax=Lipomyces tetrasporus TaxID=54092 RepID=A0AAD7QT32_9ASCO|nr:uncharacterized protein POJ06DRAFT_131157 [Lipomyces tetrasporus]KAJ8099227.1 hypothetical protein POJ06DRAFT_131157 [Lipomyces tetrasporus]
MPNLVPPFEYKRRKLWIESPSLLLVECVPDSDDEIEWMSDSQDIVGQDREDNDTHGSVDDKDGESSDRGEQSSDDKCICELIGARVEQFLEAYKFLDDTDNEIDQETTTTDEDQVETRSTIDTMELDELCKRHDDNQCSTPQLNATTSESAHIEPPNRHQRLRMTGCCY